MLEVMSSLDGNGLVPGFSLSAMKEAPGWVHPWALTVLPQLVSAQPHVKLMSAINHPAYQLMRAIHRRLCCSRHASHIQSIKGANITASGTLQAHLLV